MLENLNKNEKEIPEVKFTFREKGKSEEEIKKEVEELLKKRDELFASMGLPIPSINETETNEKDNDYPRHVR